jgi:2-(1,2-epoxy-1,2-dihydrophenyl)acetyl-CoA isomerase
MDERDVGSSVIVDRSDGIVRLSLNRPTKKNAINMQMWRELELSLAEVAANESDRVLILSGRGGSFSSGADLSSNILDPHPLHVLRWINSIYLSLYRLGKPTIAAVDGIALGAGCNLALACDLVIATIRSEFGEIFVRRGLSVDLGGSWTLPRLVGLQRARELCLFGDIISAERAEDIGLISKAVSESELDLEVNDMAMRLAAGPPVAQALSKYLLNAGSTSTIEEALENEVLAQAVNVASHDAAEAKNAFFERREPSFNGGWRHASNTMPIQP